MTTTCSQCGALVPAGEQCIDLFHRTQALEIEQPAYYAVHHLIVPCYMLQHNQYSRDGWLITRQLLNQFIADGLTPAEVRRRNRAMLSNERRTWSLTKGDKLLQVEDVAWTLTIANVRLDTAQHYCADAHDWAWAVLADTAALVKTSVHQRDP